MGYFARFKLAGGLVLALLTIGPYHTAPAQSLEAMRDDQIARLQTYVLDAVLPSGLVRDSLVLDPTGGHFHPATPDAAGFALLSLSALDHVGTLNDAESRVEQILRSHAGLNPGVSPDRSADGHFVHFMNIHTGAKQGGGWDESYSPISSALLVAGAQFASRHFDDNSQIADLANQLTDSVDFDAAIHPSLDGRIFLDMTKDGGGAGGTVRPWNEFMLVESLALRQQNANHRAVAVKHHWLNADRQLTRSAGGHAMLTDHPSTYAPAFWVHQGHFFNGDFRHDPRFEDFFVSHQQADMFYSQLVLEEAWRYGITAGVTPEGYHADALQNHPGTVFSPEAVAAWGDMDTLLEFYADQPPSSDSRYRYGMVRVSAEQPDWVSNDTGLVDHLFLLFGLVESVDPDFFATRMFPPLAAGDFNYDGVVDAADYTVWRDTLGSTTDLRADGNLNGVVDSADYVVWATADRATPEGVLAANVPEPNSVILLAGFVAGAIVILRRRIAERQSGPRRRVPARLRTRQARDAPALRRLLRRFHRLHICALNSSVATRLRQPL